MFLKKADTQESKGNLEAFGNTSFFIFYEFCDMPGAHEGLLGLRTIRLKRYSMLEPSQCIFY